VAQSPPDAGLRSTQFRRERELTWQSLAELLARIERNGISSASARELFELPVLYRAAASSLSVARSISLDRSLLAYLESLTARAYFCVYGARERFGDIVKGYVAEDLPAAVRAARWHIGLALIVMFLGVAVGWQLVALDSRWFYIFNEAWLAGGRGPDSTYSELHATLYDDHTALSDILIAFASFLFTHNAKIGILCFGLGFALGLPVLYLLFVNGLSLGAMFAIFASKGLTADFAAWLAIHGTTELGAMALCGGAGLLLGQAVGFPGRYKRRAAFKIKGRQATVVVLGAVGMFFVAALLEGLGRQLINDMGWRMGIAAAALVLWVAYFALAGRRSP
jgi:uncharacterized membrane protein SpoIIM required for sporulation